MKLELLKEKLIRKNPKYQNRPIYLKNGEDIKLAIDVDGYIIKAEGLTLIMWSSINEDINQKVIGMKIEDFIHLLQMNAATKEVAKSLEKIILSYQEAGILKSESYQKTRRYYGRSKRNQKL